MNRYPWKLLPRLASEIEHHRPEGAHADLAALLRVTWQQSEGDVTVWKLRCAQIASMCVRGAMLGGAPSDDSMYGLLRLLRRLSSKKTMKAVQTAMRAYLDELLAQARPTQFTTMERIVAEMRQRMQETLGVSQSLAQYSQLFGVSEGHLSRSFAAIAGQSFRAERRHIRMAAACQMLSGSNLKIVAVAQRLGIADPSQFVADFREEFGVTPGEYRKNHAVLATQQ